MAFAEHIEAGKLAGSDWYRGFDVVDIGFWNEPLLDPDTAVSGSIYMPVGPWAGCETVLSKFLPWIVLTYHPTQHKTLLKTNR